MNREQFEAVFYTQEYALDEIVSVDTSTTKPEFFSSVLHFQIVQNIQSHERDVEICIFFMCKRNDVFSTYVMKWV